MVVAHKILVSAQCPLVFGIWVWGLGVWGLGLTIVLKAAITWTEAPPNDPQPLRCVIIKRVQWTQRDRGVTMCNIYQG